jgi:hypothetical protein
MHEYAPRLRQDDIRPGWPVPRLVERFAARRLTWWPEIGIGFYPVEAGIEPYDQEYFDRFGRDAQSFIGRALMAARVAFVAQHCSGPLVDIGIGAGAFIEARALTAPTYGYDVNPAGVGWLKDRGLWVDPYIADHHAISLWDVLEHIQDYPALLANVRQWLFVSLPIFRDVDHAMTSKHFRPTEHCWYFTKAGLLWAMRREGFELVEENTMETELGREDIGSFAFRRRRNEGPEISDGD